jgi:hypothetical protein
MQSSYVGLNQVAIATAKANADRYALDVAPIIDTDRHSQLWQNRDRS